MKEIFKRISVRKYTDQAVEPEKIKVQYRIVSEESQADGSVVLKILRQNAAYPVGSYLD